MILLSDANVLIDLEYVGAIQHLPLIAPVEVLDVVLEECIDDRQPLLVEHVKAAGITVVPLEREWIVPARQFNRYGDLSSQDCLNLFYAQQYNRILVAGDLWVRKSCAKEGIDCRGTIWIVEELFSQKLVPASLLLMWIGKWPLFRRRLPAKELARLEKLLKTDKQ